jgi:hypothetical protein
VDAAPLAVAELAPDRAIDAAVSGISDDSHSGAIFVTNKLLLPPCVAVIGKASSG